jgi:hypothetical protein
MRPVPADEGNAHYMADFQRPEMTHCYLWAQLQAHPSDLPTTGSTDPATGLPSGSQAVQANPKSLSIPPHMPLEWYGRLYLAAPLLGDARGH